MAEPVAEISAWEFAPYAGSPCGATRMVDM